MSGFSQGNIFLANNALLQVNNSHNISNGKVIELFFFKFDLLLAVWLERLAYIHREIYLVNKPLQVPGISEDNAQGEKIVRKIKSWLEKRSFEGNCEYILSGF